MVIVLFLALCGKPQGISGKEQWGKRGQELLETLRGVPSEHPQRADPQRLVMNQHVPDTLIAVCIMPGLEGHRMQGGQRPRAKAPQPEREGTIQSQGR